MKRARFGLVQAYYREGTSDERVLTEVCVRGTYRKRDADFDVLPNETWLDLGANIGAFALYCKVRGASAVCYEPDKDCFQVLQCNVPVFECINKGVAVKSGVVDWWHSQSKTDHSRGTFVPSSKSVRSGSVDVIALDTTATYDGIKMDVEGAEGAILDEWVLPRAEKLVVEYHSSRDTSVGNFKRRLDALKKRYKVVRYPPEFDKIVALKLKKFERWVVVPSHPRGDRFVQYPMADRLIFCKGLR